MLAAVEGQDQPNSDDGSVDSDVTVKVTAAEMDGQQVAEMVEIQADDEPDVSASYAYKKKKKSEDNFEQQVLDIMKGESSHDDTDYFCHSLAKQFKSFNSQHGKSTNCPDHV